MAKHKVYVLYDARARATGDTDDATVMVAAMSFKELLSDSKSFAQTDSIWAEYDDENGTLVNEKLRPNLYSNVLLVRPHGGSKKQTRMGAPVRNQRRGV